MIRTYKNNGCVVSLDGQIVDFDQIIISTSTKEFDHRNNFIPDHIQRDFIKLTLRDGRTIYDNGTRVIAQFIIGDTSTREQKMREALESIAANTCCNSCQEAALVAQKALARPADVGLTDDEIIYAATQSDATSGCTCNGCVTNVARAVIAAHEAKKAGGV